MSIRIACTTSSQVLNAAMPGFQTRNHGWSKPYPVDPMPTLPT